jgi:ketosteroid isomerase-like protein
MPRLFRVAATGALLAIASPAFAAAPEEERASVRAQVEAADTAFWTAFNRCDAGAMTPEFTDDVEFYHDKTGLTVGRPAVVRSMIEGPCGDPSHIRLRREAVAASPRFDLLAGDFAMLTGEHRFLSSRDGGDFRHDGIARYIELWRKTAAGWQMRRVISYDHRADLPELRPVQIPSTTLARLTGIYRGDPHGPMTVTIAGNRLKVASGKAVFDLVPLGDGLFGVADRWLTFAFDHGRLVVREEGKIVATGRRDNSRGRS